MLFTAKSITLAEYQWLLIPFNSENTLTGVHFFDETNGIIVGDAGTYLVSSNGGSNWMEYPKLTEEHLTSIVFIDSKFGIITSFDTLCITKDGGKNWQKKGFGLDVYFYQIGFYDKMNLWVVGEYGTVLFSSDGGENWEDLGLGSENDIYNLYVINKNKIIVSGSNGYIARIINNGELTEYMDVGYDSYITSMKFLSEKVGFVGIDSLKILKTTDGGDSWKEVYKGDPDDWIMSFEFIDNLEGWAVSDMGLILRTTDGGNSWNVVLNTGRPLNTCYFLNKNFGFITGFMGTIYKYTDIVNSAEDFDKFCNECPYLVVESNIINIKNINTDDKIEIFNSTGLSIFKAYSTSNEFSLSTKNFANGLYFISINNNISKFLKF